MSEQQQSKEQKSAAMDLRYQNGKEVVKGGILGAFIGLAVIVPGVSGSAVAIIFRLYEKLLYALGGIFRRFKESARFLLPIALGGIVGLAAGFFGVRFLLNLLPFAIVALFAGLMLGAFPAVTDEIKGEKPTPLRIILFLLGLLFPIGLSALSVFGTPDMLSLENLAWYHYLLFLLVGYAIAVTQLVPGLSATALLMTFGCFTPLMNSVSLTYWQENPMVLLVYACLAVGFILGLLTFSNGLSRLLEKKRAPAFYTIAGLSLGSIVTMFFNPEIVEVYESWTIGAAMWRELGIGMALFGIGIIAATYFVRYERNRVMKNK
ncbi:MAG TPA: DUF368 domain-containing protein [Candidatus Gallimonas gallistercoris]|uniref:DUF368 domain-containing protein n=1 Tax=Candidatus Gallimonas gallistercoris TaxID=2838602 RepID=A0A9D2H213_9FIRM|nr:DUF368 domain-containing protein [Candidatus Gallimonas gallistercoris]